MRITKVAGMPYIRFHDLRHTAATLLLLKGVHPKTVSEMRGNASVAITLAVYSLCCREWGATRPRRWMRC